MRGKFIYGREIIIKKHQIYHFSFFVNGIWIVAQTNY